MYNPLEQLGKNIYVDSNGITATKASWEIMSCLMRDINVILRVREGSDFIFATPSIYDSANNMIWFSYTINNNSTQLIGVDIDGKIVQ